MSIQGVLRKYQTEGLSGILSAVSRRIFPEPELINPMQAALNEVIGDGDFTIVQIGAHIANTPNDPLFERLSKRRKEDDGRLICVEPIKEHFEKLVENYRNNPNVFFENSAISEQNGEAIMYRLGVDPVEYDYPEWLSQLSSLKKERMESLWDRYEADEQYKAFYLEHRIAEKVNCITVAELLARHKLSKIDLLQMDVEGYELEILKTIDFNLIPVRFVNYESVLLHENKIEAENLMRNQGYLLAEHGQDTFCYKEADKEIVSAE